MADKKTERRRSMLTRDEIAAALKEVGESLHAQFEDEVGTHRSRLLQLDGALTNAAVAAENLFDEEVREVDLATRIMERATVHGSDEVRSPIPGRSHKDYAVVARRAK